MRCPACGSELVGASIRREEFYECPAGHGTWVDVEPFQRLVADFERRAAVLVQQIGRGAERIVPIQHDSLLPCPRCRRAMTRYEYARDSGVHVDACRQHGIWFDHDELRRIIQFIQARESEPRGDGRGDEAASRRRADANSAVWF
jgi:Zn-finger nucleic acid-binding protein